MIQLDPAEHRALYLRSSAHHRLGRHDQAIDDATAAIRLQARPAYYSARASAYLAKGDLDRADADAEAALRLDPGDANAREVRARVLELRSKAEQEESLDLGGKGDEMARLIAGLCPACTFRGKKAPAAIPADLLGKTVTCPSCGHQFRVGPAGQGGHRGRPGTVSSDPSRMMRDLQRQVRGTLDDLQPGGTRRRQGEEVQDLGPPEPGDGTEVDVEDIDLLIEEETGPGEGLGTWPDGEAGEGVAVPIPGQWFRRPEGSPEGPPTVVVSPGGMRVHPGYVYGIDVGVEALERKEPDFASLSLLRPASCMRWLKLNKCKITDACLAHLAGLTHLERLDLRGPNQEFTDAGLAHLKGLRRLRQLNFSDCKQIGDAGLAHLKGLIELEDLNLRSCRRVTDAGLTHLRGMSRMRKLALAGCKVTDAGLACLQGMTELEELDLSSCDRITDAGLATLRKLARLKKVNTQWCKGITDAGRALGKA